MIDGNDKWTTPPAFHAWTYKDDERRYWGVTATVYTPDDGEDGDGTTEWIYIITVGESDHFENVIYRGFIRWDTNLGCPDPDTLLNRYATQVISVLAGFAKDGTKRHDAGEIGVNLFGCEFSPYGRADYVD